MQKAITIQCKRENHCNISISLFQYNKFLDKVQAKMVASLI